MDRVSYIKLQPFKLSIFDFTTLQTWNLYISKPTKFEFDTKFSSALLSCILTIKFEFFDMKFQLKLLYKSINCNNCIRAEFRCHYLSIHLRKIPEEGKFTSFSIYLSIRLTLCCHIFNNDDNDNICTRAISLVCVSVVWRRRKSYYYHRQLKFEAIESEAPYMIYVNLIKSYCFPLLMSVDILPLPNPPHDSPKNVLLFNFCESFSGLFTRKKNDGWAEREKEERIVMRFNKIDSNSQNDNNFWCSRVD